MFSAMAADLAGTADNCTPVRKAGLADSAVVGDSLTYLRRSEMPYIFLKSKVMEWIFTNFGMIMIERENAAGVKRTIKRLDWQTHHIDLDSITFITPGVSMTDYSCDLKFQVGNRHISIDIVKSEIAYAKLVYLALVELATEQQRYDLMMTEARAIKTQIIINGTDPSTISSTARELVTQFAPLSYADVFERAMSDHPADRL